MGSSQFQGQLVCWDTMGTFLCRCHPILQGSFATVSSEQQLQQEWYSRLDSNVYCTLTRARRYGKKLNLDFFQNVDSFEIIYQKQIQEQKNEI